MGLLKGSSVYLIGAVDHADDPRAWRRKLAEEVLVPMGIKVYDPLVKPSWLGDACVSGPDSIGQLVDPSKDFLIFKEFLKNPTQFTASESASIMARMDYIRKFCLRMASNCDFIIGSLPKRFTVGTLEELKVATDAGKPVLLHLPDGFETSTWLPAQIDGFFRDSFKSMEELGQRLKDIDSGKAKVDKRSQQ